MLWLWIMLWPLQQCDLQQNSLSLSSSGIYRMEMASSVITVACVPKYSQLSKHCQWESNRHINNDFMLRIITYTETSSAYFIE